MATQIENILPTGCKWKTRLFILVINLSFFLYIYFWFIYLFIFCLPLCMRVHCKPSCVSICKHVFLFPCLNICQFLFLCVCLFDCYPAPAIIFAKSLYFYYNFWFYNIIFIFINRQPSFISFLHLSTGGEFKTLSLSGMVYP